MCCAGFQGTHAQAFTTSHTDIHALTLCINTDTSTLTCVPTHTDTLTQVHTHTDTRSHLHLQTQTHMPHHSLMHAHSHMPTLTHVHISTPISIWAFSHTHILTLTFAHTHIHSRICTPTHMLVLTITHIHTHVLAHTQLPTLTCTPQDPRKCFPSWDAASPWACATPPVLSAGAWAGSCPVPVFSISRGSDLNSVASRGPFSSQVRLLGPYVCKLTEAQQVTLQNHTSVITLQPKWSQPPLRIPMTGSHGNGCQAGAWQKEAGREKPASPRGGQVG